MSDLSVVWENLVPVITREYPRLNALCRKRQMILFTQWSVSHALDIQYSIFTTLSNDLLANYFISPGM